MAYIYAMSDIHGCIDTFEEMLGLVDLSPENKLVLCGDYIDGKHEHPEALTYFKDFQKAHRGQVICLLGNHEADLLNEYDMCGAMVIGDDPELHYDFDPVSSAPLRDAETYQWLRRLKGYYETDDQIFVHAGVDEEAGNTWNLGYDKDYYAYKFPHVEGPFIKDIVAGHVGTFSMCGENRVYWDGASHFYIDGTTEISGILPLLKYDTKAGAYSSFMHVDGKWIECKIN